jgi:O-antigen/teichoic acid export membrane protein
MNPPEEIQNQVVKVASAWGVIAFTSWAEFAAFLGALYTMVLLTEWFWKKMWRPLLVRLGYLPADRRKEDKNDE